MLLHGDELGRSQHGNNNTYAQDSEISWVNWEFADEPLIEFTRAVANLRAEHPTFRRRRFFNGRIVKREEGTDTADIVWLGTDGAEMTDEDWNTAYVRSMGMYLNGQGIRGRDERGERIEDKDFLLYFNASEETVPVTLPSSNLHNRRWKVVIDTAGELTESEPFHAEGQFTMEPRSLIVMRDFDEPEPEPDHSVAASVSLMTPVSYTHLTLPTIYSV